MGFGTADLSSLSQSIDADDVADVASSLSPDELATAAVSPDAAKVAEKVDVPGAEDKVSSSLEAR